MCLCGYIYYVLIIFLFLTTAQCSPILDSVERHFCVVDYVCIGVILRQVLEGGYNLSVVDVLVEVLFVFVDYLANTELYIWYFILQSLNEHGSEQLVDLVAFHVRHHYCQGVQAAHPEIVAFIFSIKYLLYSWKELLDNPLLLELLS